MQDYLSTPIRKALILGSAALKIGEAGEFDYSGSQAIKALKEENIEVVLINPNIATIQTSKGLADKIYMLPVNPETIEKVIEKEKPEGIFLSFGGQTALNSGVELYEKGVLQKHGVRVMGTQVDVIRSTEDRQKFADILKEIKVDTPKSYSASNLCKAGEVVQKIGFPVMVRIAYALGGLGSGVCKDQKDFDSLIETAFSHTNQILVEESLKGWKEVEYEVIRDSYDNCITVCNMENFDPLGIHTGESIVVAPSQTLTNRQYHCLREISIRVIRRLGIVGECNIQYALNPNSDEYRVIEVNARLSRSSALASKATGYPLAFVAAKLALGYSLTELLNSITQTTMACFEPALDYIVVKIPRWDLNKFHMVNRQLGSSMKSVGEVMAIGKTFEEALQKGLRMLDIGANGIVGNPDSQDKKTAEEIQDELENPTDLRIFSVAEAFRRNWSIEKIRQMTRIDLWFLSGIKKIVEVEKTLSGYANGICPKEILLTAKKAGFSDRQLAVILGSDESKIRMMRKNYNIRAKTKQIDTLAGEYPAKTNYLFLTYNGEEDEPEIFSDNSIIILGSGVYRIGSSVEFDWCCVNAVKTVRQKGIKAIVMNYNPETVSTDYDEADYLFFDEISPESILEVYDRAKPSGVLISMGGQVASNLAMTLKANHINVLGTAPENIDRAENRHTFSLLLDELKINQPAWSELSSMPDIKGFIEEVGYPVIIRPSYVLSGAAMGVATDDRELETYLNKAAIISPEYPVVVSKFEENAKEIEMDAVANKGEVVIYAISEHIENAGVHSGDATLVLPAQRTYLETMRKILKIAQKLAAELQITGPFNIQFIAKENQVKVIECNLRASRSLPFVSKVTDKNFVEIATRCILGEAIDYRQTNYTNLDYVAVKAPQFSFSRLNGADPTLGVEMSSTGEVGCLGDNFYEALLKAMISVGYKYPIRSVLLSSGPLENKVDFLESMKYLQKKNICVYATHGTHQFLKKHGYSSELVGWPDEKFKPNVMEILQNNPPDLVINIPKNFMEYELNNDYLIRRSAVDRAIPIITNTRLAQRFIEACYYCNPEDLKIRHWAEYMELNQK